MLSCKNDILDESSKIIYFPTKLEFIKMEPQISPEVDFSCTYELYISV